MNKLPIGSLTSGAHVGGSGTGNDQQNRDSIDRASSKNGITLERKRPRYSIMCFTLNGPTLNQHPGGVYDMVGPETAEQEYDVSDSDFTHATGTQINFQYEFREPAVFLGGQLFVGNDLTASPSATTVTVSKRQSADIGTSDVTTYELASLSSRTINNRLSDEQHTDLLYYIPGGRAHFATGERFVVTVTPDADSAASSAEGLQGCSMTLWFKTLHV